ncbi:hypothetical protein EDEG_03793 [Edhazardia aedis USNM 41457]|uniref:Uncharacterized protein n=1 Tax=Edhazardia aedis (strain USNM 41457) TaxID=1003232 RepID=J9D1F1_EDHAE|nr:hypothetical protein EDEG_03793 [Edhazardia aedis USNM 41457]|eukprot:EJW01661.1 hypothetical protein EDEG_03793 [Edhazardia aedis USNM 41457]
MIPDQIMCAIFAIYNINLLKRKLLYLDSRKKPIRKNNCQKTLNLEKNYLLLETIYFSLLLSCVKRTTQPLVRSKIPIIQRDYILAIRFNKNCKKPPIFIKSYIYIDEKGY